MRIGLNEQHVKEILEKHLVPEFTGSKVILTVPSPEVYDKIVKEIVWVSRAANIQEG